MTAVFADTVYWIAIVRPNDPWAASASRARRLLGTVRLVTTDEALIEFLTALAGGERSREQAARMVHTLLTHPGVEVIPQSRGSFLRGLALYEGRGDKHYSMTDCISMDRMRERSIPAVLTNDRHFAGRIRSPDDRERILEARGSHNGTSPARTAKLFGNNCRQEFATEHVKRSLEQTH